MKKLLSALVLALALCGCTTKPNEDTPKPSGPAAIATLDVATFADELANTALSSVKVDAFYYDADGAHEIEETLTEEEAQLRTTLVDTLKTLNVSEAENQNKVYGSLTLFIDLNSVIDSNYARLALYEVDGTNVLVIKTNEKFVNYNVDDAASAVLTSVSSAITDYYTAE
ncbi:MAG: hypothetical protein ACI4U3_05815 [Traorella sp.]